MPDSVWQRPVVPKQDAWPAERASDLLELLSIPYSGEGGLARLREFQKVLRTEFRSALQEVESWPWREFIDEEVVGLLWLRRQARENAFALFSQLGGNWAITREAVTRAPESYIFETRSEADAAAGITFPRRWLYLNYLQLLDRGRPPDRDTSLLHDDLLVHAATRLAGSEVVWRGLRHIGFQFALLWLCQDEVRAGRRRTEAEVEKRLKRARALVRRRARRGVLALLATREATASDSRSHRLEERALIDGQTWETLHEHLHDKSWDEVLLQAISGKLNILPRAVANDLIDRARKGNADAVGSAPDELHELHEGSATTLRDEDPKVRVDVEELIIQFVEGGPPRRGNAKAANAGRVQRLLRELLGHPTGSEGGASERTRQRHLSELRRALGLAPRGRGRPRKT